MEITHFLAKILGLYLVIMSIFVLLNPQTIRNLVQAFSAEKPLIFLSGIITLLLGLMMVVSHNVWVWDWPVIITIFAWIILLSGILRIFAMEKVIQMAHCLVQNNVYLRVLMVVYLLIGLFLIYKAWW